MARKVKRNPTRKPKPAPATQQELLERIEKFFGSIAPDLIKRLETAEFAAGKAQYDLQLMRDRLARLLSPAQRDAANIAGVEPWDYAIEWVSLAKEKLFPPESPMYLPLMNQRFSDSSSDLG